MKLFPSLRILFKNWKRNSTPKDIPNSNIKQNWRDAFISHASEDKASVVIPLRDFLVRHGISVWLDELDIIVGDSLENRIGSGITNSQFGVVVIGPTYFSKPWTMMELNMLISMENPPEKVVLPVLHGINLLQLKHESPELHARLTTDTIRGVEHAGRMILEAIFRTRKQKSPAFITLANDGTPDGIDLEKGLTRFWDEGAQLSLVWPQTFVDAFVANQIISKKLAPALGREGYFCVEGSSQMLRKMDMETIVTTASHIRKYKAAFEVRIHCIVRGLSNYAGRGDTYITGRSLNVFCRLAYGLVTSCFDWQRTWIPWNSVTKKGTPDQIRAATGLTGELIRAQVTLLDSNTYPVSDLGHLTVWAPRSDWEDILWDRANPELLELYLIPQIELQLMVANSEVIISYSSHKERWHVTHFDDEDNKPVYIRRSRPEYT